MTVHLPVPFWPGGVENVIHQRRAVLLLEGQNVAGDFDQVRVEHARVPFGEDLVHLGGGHAEAVSHEVVGLADQLHVAVFDAVVDHLDVMAGAAFADPVAARDAAFHLGGDRLEDRLHVRPGGRRTARHDARTVDGHPLRRPKHPCRCKAIPWLPPP